MIGKYSYTVIFNEKSSKATQLNFLLYGEYYATTHIP